MKIGVIADVHANLDALKAVLADAADRVDAWWLLGDAVGRGPDPVETVLLLKKIVKPFSSFWQVGNHDLYVAGRSSNAGIKAYEQAAHAKHRRALRAYKPAGSHTPELWAWIRRNWRKERAAPRRLEGEKIDYWFVHGVLGGPRMNAGDLSHSYLFPWDIAMGKAAATVQLDKLRALQRPQRGVALIHGHTHVPYLAAIPRGGPSQTLRLLPIRYNTPLPLVYFGHTLFINPGSVGQPRNGDSRPHAAYGILDTRFDTFEFRSVYYDCAGVCRRMRAQNYADILIDILSGNHEDDPNNTKIDLWKKWSKVYVQRPWGWEPIAQQGD